MFRYIQQYAEKMQHADIYPSISLGIFFIFFVVLLIGVKKMGRQQARHLANIPFTEQGNEN